MREKLKFISLAISQINWESYKRGYAHIQDLDHLKSKLQNIKKDDLPLELSLDEINLLRISGHNSLAKIANCDYGPNLDGDKLREEALSPLYDFMIALKELEEENVNQTK